MEATALYSRRIDSYDKIFVIRQMSGPTYAWMMREEAASRWVHNTAKYLSLWASKLPEDIKEIPKSHDYVTLEKIDG